MKIVYKVEIGMRPTVNLMLFAIVINMDDKQLWSYQDNAQSYSVK